MEEKIRKDIRYRNELNVRYLKALFYEHTGADKSTVIYTLKDLPHQGFPSLYRLYMDCNDPTEYEFANEYLDGWEHWTMLCECTWFQPFRDRWRKELELRETAAALRKIRAAAHEDSRQSFQANKFLIERGWEEKASKGRPSKQAVKKEAQLQAAEQMKLKKDIKLMEDLP